MSVAIPVDGKLWGMVSFHHSTPKRVHPKDMQNLASLSYMISSLIEGISWRQEATAHQAISDRVLKDTPIQSLVIHHESQETRKKDDDAQVFFFSTDSALDESNQAIQVLLKDLSLIRTYFSSDGAIIQINSSATLYDVTDEYKEEAIRICRFLRYLKSTTLITSRACQRDFEKELRECYCTGQSGAQVFDIIAGLLLFPISEDGSSFFAFIRIERVQVLFHLV